MNQYISQIFNSSNDYKGILFLDRDGTITKDVDYLRSVEEIRILPTVIEGIKLLNKNHIAVIVITNQAVVARGYISVKQLLNINIAIVKAFSIKHAIIDAIYSCPHHPNADKIKYRITCDCRKPGIAMFKQAISDYNIQNIIGMIGDNTCDVQAGKKMHLPTVIVNSGYKGRDGKYNVTPDYFVKDFISAVKILLYI